MSMATTTKAPPRRIQRSRKKGDRLPPNTVCVTRPLRWGNPYQVVRTEAGEWEVHGDNTEYAGFADRVAATRFAVTRFRQAVISGAIGYTVADVRRELAGKTLACWCPEGAVCHGDILLAMAGSARAGQRAATRAVADVG
jgi:hypothetical protein